MKITTSWLKDHLDTKLNENQIIDKLTDIGLEVESVENQSGDLDSFIIAKILKTEKHPDADKLKICNVDIGEKKTIEVVCGAQNAKEGLITIYAPPGSIIPKNQMKLVVSKIRGVTSYGMLCSESELNLSDESDGITELSDKKYNTKIGNNYFPKSSLKVIDISITPNRADCLGVKGIARDLAAAGLGKLKNIKKEKLIQKHRQKINVKIAKEKNQGCNIFGSCLVTGVKNTESPKWLKEKIISLGQKPISAIVDITNYVMFDLNRPLHAYDADKIDKEIIIRNSKKGETFKALDNKNYILESDMCVISDNSGVLGLGGIIGGTRSGTELETQNVLIEAAYFNPRSIRKTSKTLNIDTDAKFRFERGIDPLSVEQGLQRAAELVKKICGGEVSKFDIQKVENYKNKKIKFEILSFEKITGFNIEQKDIIKILENLGFEIKKDQKSLILKVPSWRPDIEQEIDVIEELVRIYGYNKIQIIEPEKIRKKSTLNNKQRLFHFLQRSIASKGFLETITWSFTNSKINQLFSEDKKEVNIVNPISTDLNVLRNSIFSNLIIYLSKNLDRGIKDISFFEIGPIFFGSQPGQQETVVCGLRAGKISRLNWLEKDRLVDVFDVKQDVIKSLVEAGFNQNKLYIDDKAPSYYHPGKSGRIFINQDKEKVVAYFGEIHPNILKKIDIKTESVAGFEIFLDNIKQAKKTLNDQKTQYKFSDYQKSERDFAFILNKDFQVQKLIEIISKIDQNLIRTVKVFDVYEGDNIPEGKKSIALNVTIQSSEKTLKDEDLDRINQLIISTVEDKTGAKIRS
ncbi:phenylalanine--tRNA ligase subunit beta [Candidatus Pelagibacter sp.]|jgi:phenylalanyl-tRNA synthetase beta chain|nr:phenylalanine--tRNA ligase subunit beta [Candidatus Pelagibacter sp.]